MLTFETFDVYYYNCWDYVEVSYDSFSQRYCGSTIPGPFTSTGTIAVRINSNSRSTASGFLGVVCCSAHVTTDLTPSEWFVL